MHLAIFVSVSTPIDFYVLVIDLQNCKLLFSVLMYLFLIPSDLPVEKIASELAGLR